MIRRGIDLVGESEESKGGIWFCNINTWKRGQRAFLYFEKLLYQFFARSISQNSARPLFDLRCYCIAAENHTLITSIEKGFALSQTSARILALDFPPLILVAMLFCDFLDLFKVIFTESLFFRAADSWSWVT